MNSYKCVQCGLTNWKADEFCKRCRVPNPYSSQSFQSANFSPAVTIQNNIMTQPIPPPPQLPMTADFSSPPPPNVFGSSVGSTSMDAFNYHAQPAFPANRPPVRAFNQSNFSPESAEELKKAEKQIRDAWICGVIVCAFTALIAFLIPLMASSQNYIEATVPELILSVIIFGGLTIGVYFKNRACAILLCGLFILDKIVTFAATGKLSGAVMAFIFIYYFAYGIQGAFAYHKLTKQR